MSQAGAKMNWGMAPWVIDFRPTADPRVIPDVVDFAIVGGGFTGLATAACLRRMNPAKSVVLFEAETIGAGASGHTGGMCLGETAVGPMPGLGDVLSGFSGLLRDLGSGLRFEFAGSLGTCTKKGRGSFCDSLE